MRKLHLWMHAILVIALSMAAWGEDKLWVRLLLTGDAANAYMFVYVIRRP